MIKLAYAILLALCGAVLIHIAVIFLLPKISEPRLMTQLQELSLSSDPLVFGETATSQTIQGLDPFFQYRVCFYDLAEGVFSLSSTSDVPFFSAAFVSENGDVVFSITDRQTINRKLNIEIRSKSTQQSLSQLETDDQSVEGAVPIFVQAEKGYAIVRAFVPDSSWNTIAANFLIEISCQSGGAGN